MVRKDSRLKNLPRETLQDLWDLKYPADPAEQEPLGLVEICAILPERYGVTLQKTALSEFYQWLQVERRMWARETLVDQMKEIIARDKSLSPEQVRAAGQRLFMADGILERDVKKFKAAADSEGADYKAKQKDAEIEIRRENIKLLKRKVALLEKKAAQADAAKDVLGTTKLSPEEQNRRLREILK
jgi:hypothetical protein